MRKLCPNFDREDGLDTVLEVPIPEEMFASRGNSRSHKSVRTTMKAWMRSHHSHVDRSATSPLGREAELQLMLGVIGAPLVPLPVQTHKFSLTRHLKEDPMVSLLPSFKGVKPGVVVISLLFFLFFVFFPK